LVPQCWSMKELTVVSRHKLSTSNTLIPFGSSLTPFHSSFAPFHSSLTPFHSLFIFSLSFHFLVPTLFWNLILQAAMTMTKVCANTSSPRRSPRLFHKYLKPGALAKIRDSKIKARNNQRAAKISLYEALLLTPTSPSSPIQDDDHLLNQNIGVPCFISTVNFTSPSCLRRKKLFAVTPTFTHADESQF